MKEARFDFSGGVNTYSDKSVLEPHYVTVADNVDLRSGNARPFNAPSFVKGAESSTVSLYEYIGKFYTAAKRREYASEFINFQDVVYYTEHGSVPRKIVGGTDVKLGTARPTIAPTVTVGTTLQPVITVTAGNEGALAHNSVRSYRVAAKTDKGVSVPSASQVVTIVGTRYKKDGKWKNKDDGSAYVAWTPVVGAINYLVFAGAQGSEQLVATLTSGQTSWTDAGNNPTSGEYATTYDSQAPYSYVYTFERFVNGIVNESAPSDITYASGSGGTRTITFSPEDGFMTDAISVTSGITLTDSPTAYPALTISAIVNQAGYKQVKFTTSASHGLTNEEKVIINITGDSNWVNREVEVWPDASTVPDPTVFYVKNCPSVTGSAGTVQKCKTDITFTTAPTTPAVTGDMVRLTVANNKTADGKATTTVYGKVTVTDSTHYVVQAYTAPQAATPVTCSAASWVPNNGYIRYRKLYRSGDTSEYQLVEELDPWQMTYQDNVPAANLGEILPSSYQENGIDILFNVPPLGLSQPTLHNGMMFGIDGYTVRWTPIGQHDAWPDNFYVRFPFKPLAIKSFAQALVVLCSDAVYRIEGSEPTRLVQIGTGADEGCIAPHSAQVTEAGLFYLSRKGIMVFNGTEAKCLTDKKVHGSFFTCTSWDHAGIASFLIPTIKTQAYAWLCDADGLLGGTPNGHTNPPDGIVYAIRSFVHDGRYWLYYGDDPNYGANGMVCLDYSAADAPLTTMGIRPVDVHVNQSDECFMLLDHALRCHDQ